MRNECSKMTVTLTFVYNAGGKTGIGREKQFYASRNIPMTVTGENRCGPGKETPHVTSKS